MSADAVVIRFSAWKIFRMLLLCCGSSAAGYWIVHASFNSLVDTRPPLLVVIAGYIVLVSSLLALLLSLVPLMKAGPALVLEERGFDDRSAAASLGFVEWADIAGVRLWSSGSQSALCLRLKNPDKYAQGIGPIKRAMLKINHRTAPGEIALSAILLAVRFERLEALVMSHLSVAQGAERQHAENISDEA